ILSAAVQALAMNGSRTKQASFKEMSACSILRFARTEADRMSALPAATILSNILSVCLVGLPLNLFYQTQILSQMRVCVPKFQERFVAVISQFVAQTRILS
ncbi:MAG: hypothetical protein M3Q33_08495, partial [Acidobacteriota bacterium]|nr:hypothetical protein [Acidobacteriota bacterium]